MRTRCAAIIAGLFAASGFAGCAASSSAKASNLVQRPIFVDGFFRRVDAGAGVEVLCYDANGELRAHLLSGASDCPAPGYLRLLSTAPEGSAPLHLLVSAGGEVRFAATLDHPQPGIIEGQAALAPGEWLSVSAIRFDAFRRRDVRSGFSVRGVAK